MNVRTTLLLIAVLVAAAGTGARAATAKLSNDVVPVSYDLSVHPFAPGPTVEGSETIVVRLGHDLGAVTLNQLQVNVREATIDGQPVRPALSDKLQQLTLVASRRLSAGEHSLHLDFVSHPSFPGFQVTGTPANLYYATAFEPSQARASFPCFDEPQFRARFTLHVKAPAAATVISNMPETRVTPDSDGMSVHDFQPTPPMPTYLVTYDIGKFTHADGEVDGKPVRIFAAPGREAQERAVLSDTEAIVPFYTKFFSTPYPLPKLDVVVVKGGFDSALEGWGAINVYDENEVFGDQLGREELLAHEIAHQWVGDLVDMAWWRDTFVAEGLAEFAERQAVAHVFSGVTSWIDDDSDVGAILNRPIKPGTKPLIGARIATDLNDDDFQAFDLATYDKGAAIVRQWQRLVGDEAFARAIAGYLRAHAYGSATFEQFWSAFPEPNARAYASAWFEHPGYPIVTLDASCIGGTSHVSVSQRAFVADATVGAAYRRQLWPFPLVLRVAGRERVLSVPAQPYSRFEVPGCGVSAVDDDFRPYMRLLYRGDALRDIAARAPRERNRLLQDYSAAQQYGYVTGGDYEAIISAAGSLNDIDGLTVRSIASRFSDIAGAVRGSASFATIANIDERVLRPVIPGALDGITDFWSAQAQSSALMALADVGDARFSTQAREVTLERAASGWPMGRSGMAWSAAAAGGVTAGQADVERVESMLRAGQFQELGQVFLTHVSDKTLLAEILDDAIRDRHIAGDSFSEFLFDVGSMHPDVAYEYLRAHLRSVRATLPPSQQAYAICSGVANALWPAASPKTLEAFLASIVSPNDRAVLLKADTEIERHWHDRQTLERELRAPS
ncbi:MAG TPA: M1 family metallopeptidase [Candidatus Baltobacteraceae bacterium]